MTQELIPSYRQAAEKLVELTLATCVSDGTRRVYGIYLTQYLASGHPLTREGVALHVQALRSGGASTSSILGVLAAVRKLAAEAEVRGLLTYAELSQIKSIKGGKADHTRRGMWLTMNQTQKLLDLPDSSTYFGKRDKAILAVLVGCGLRRAEMASLRWDHYQMREDRMCLVDFRGKGDKRRTLPVPTWAQPAVDQWKHTLENEPLPVPTTPAEHGQAGRRTYDPTLFSGGIGYEALQSLVEAYGARLGVDLQPHDLRRTLAQLMRKAGAPLEQVQATLGHSNLATTQKYLGSSLELGRGTASVDKFTLKASKPAGEGLGCVVLDSDRAGLGCVVLEADASTTPCIDQQLTRDKPCL